MCGCADRAVQPPGPKRPAAVADVAWDKELFESFVIHVPAALLSEVTAGSLYGANVDVFGMGSTTGSLPRHDGGHPWYLTGVLVDSSTAAWVEAYEEVQAGRSLFGRAPPDTDGLSALLPESGRIGIRISDAAAAQIWLSFERRRDGAICRILNSLTTGE